MDAKEIRQLIIAEPHHRIEIRPQTYNANRIESTIELELSITQLSVSLRGWSLPHIPGERANIVHTDSYIECWADYDWIREVWRFYKSSQFVGLFRLHDLKPEWQVQLRERSYVIDDDVKGFLNVLGIVYQITEIHELASRLARHFQLLEGVYVLYELKGISDFALSTDDIRRSVGGNIYRATTIKIEKEYGFAEIANRNRHKALEAVAEVFAHFGVTIRPDVLRQMQDDLYALRMGGNERERDQSYDWS